MEAKIKCDICNNISHVYIYFNDTNNIMNMSNKCKLQYFYDGENYRGYMYIVCPKCKGMIKL